MTKKIVVVLLVLILVIVVSVAAAAENNRTIPVRADLVGTVIAIGDGTNIFDVELKGKPKNASARGVSVTGLPADIADLPTDNQCADIPGPDGFNITEAQITVIYKRGMVFGNAADGGYVCFVSAANPATGYAYAPYIIVGGNGRYEGVTGDIIVDLTTYAFGGAEGKVIAEAGTVTGDIKLP